MATKKYLTKTERASLDLQTIAFRRLEVLSRRVWSKGQGATKASGAFTAEDLSQVASLYAWKYGTLKAYRPKYDENGSIYVPHLDAYLEEHLRRTFLALLKKPPSIEPPEGVSKDLFLRVLSGDTFSTPESIADARLKLQSFRDYAYEGITLEGRPLRRSDVLMALEGGSLESEYLRRRCRVKDKLPTRQRWHRICKFILRSLSKDS